MVDFVTVACVRLRVMFISLCLFVRNARPISVWFRCLVSLLFRFGM